MINNFLSRLGLLLLILSSQVSCGFYQNFPESPKIYSLTFDKNNSEAQGVMDQITAPEGSQLVLPPLGFSKPGWSFLGWSPNSSSGAVSLPDRALFSMDQGAVTLYAIWADDSLVPIPVNSLTIGVWLQDPQRTRKGVINAVEYKSLGVNTFVGLFRWPYETLPGATSPWTYKGYTKDTAETLKTHGLKAYAGNDAAAVDWLASHPEYDDTFAGYLLGDEPDMFKSNYKPLINPEEALKWVWATPDTWKLEGNRFKALDPSKVFYANFGKPFAGGFYSPDSGSTREKDFAKYVDPTTEYSCDFYGMTDPYNSRSGHGIWTYGKAVKNASLYASGRPVYGFLEASAPWKPTQMKGAENNYIALRMNPKWIMPIVWNMVISGATGIVYFCHNFYEGGADGCLGEPGMPAAMRAANASIQKYADILLSPNAPGTTVSITGPVDVIHMTKKLAGSTYIFAMGHGNADNIYGAPVSAGFTLAGFTNQAVLVLNENRTLPMTGGSFTETFDPYEIHIYKITP